MNKHHFTTAVDDCARLRQTEVRTQHHLTRDSVTTSTKPLELSGNYINHAL